MGWKEDMRLEMGGKIEKDRVGRINIFLYPMTLG
jgi:hypothetical protein